MPFPVHSLPVYLCDEDLRRLPNANHLPVCIWIIESFRLAIFVLLYNIPRLSVHEMNFNYQYNQ